MRISDNFDIFVESITNRLDTGEIDQDEFIDLFATAYESVEDEIVSDLVELVRESVITKDEAFQFTAYIDQGFPKVEESVMDVVEKSLADMVEIDVLEADRRVVNGEITDSERLRAQKAYEKQQKKAAFKEKLKKVGKGVAAGLAIGATAYGAYKGGQALSKSAKDGAIRDYIDEKKDKKEERKHQQEEAQFKNLGKFNRRRENKDYADLYQRYGREDNDIQKEEKRQLKRAKNEYEKDKIRSEFAAKKIRAEGVRKQELDDRMDVRYKYNGPEREKVAPIRKADGSIDKYATRRAQREANKKDREARKDFRDSVLKDESKRAAEFQKLDQYRDAERARALRPMSQKLGEAIGSIPDKVAKAVDDAVENHKQSITDKVDKRYKKSYGNV